MLFLYVRDALPVVAYRVRGLDPGPAGISDNFPSGSCRSTLQVYTSG